MSAHSLNGKEEPQRSQIQLIQGHKASKQQKPDRLRLSALRVLSFLPMGSEVPGQRQDPMSGQGHLHPPHLGGGGTQS